MSTSVKTIFTINLVLVMVFGSIDLTAWSDPGHAKKGQHQIKHAHKDKKHYRYNRSDHDEKHHEQPLLRFNNNQGAMLLDLLLGRTNNSQIISPALYRSITYRETLPPGIQMRLAKGKPLPPGIAKKMVPLPTSVNSYLGLPSRHPVQLGVAGNDVILYSVATGLVLDILRNVLN